MLFQETGKKTGDMDMKPLTSSAMYNFQVFGGAVEFYGSNVTDVKMDKDNLGRWQKLLTVDESGDKEAPYRQYAWGNIGYKVISGENVEIYVSAGATD